MQHDTYVEYLFHETPFHKQKRQAREERRHIRDMRVLYLVYYGAVSVVIAFVVVRMFISLTCYGSFSAC